MLRLSSIMMLLLYAVSAQDEAPLLRGGSYPLKERRPTEEGEEHRRDLIETMVLTLDQLYELGPLSFSEDTAPVELEDFHLVLYETTGVVPIAPSVETVETALAAFLKAELNDFWNQNHQVASLQASVIGQQATATRKAGETMTGTLINVAVDVLFEYQPNPKYEAIEASVQTILMGNLTYLVSNITSIVEDTEDEFLADIHTVEYRGQMLEPPQETTDDDSNNNTFVGIVTTQEQDSGFFGSVRFFVPVLLGSALILIAIILFLVPQRKRQDDEQEGVTESKLIQPLSEIGSSEGAGLNLYYDDNSPMNRDAYSLEPDVEDIPLTPPSYRKDGGSPKDSRSVFSGLSSNVSRGVVSPKNGGDSRSVFSFISNLGSKSTILASNVTTNQHPSPADSSVKQQRVMSPRSGSGTPRSRMSSLFTFSEEESEGDHNNNTNSQGDIEKNKESTSAQEKEHDIVIKKVVSDDQAPFDELDLSASRARAKRSAQPSPPMSPMRIPSPLAAMAAGAMALVKGAVYATQDNDKKEVLQHQQQNEAPEDEMTSFTTDDIAKDIQKAEEEFKKSKQISTTDDTASPKEELPVNPKEASSCPDNCGPSTCGAGFSRNMATSSDISLADGRNTSLEAMVNKRSRSNSPRRFTPNASPKSNISKESSETKAPSLSVDTGNNNTKATMNEPSPSAKSYNAPSVAISSPKSDKSSKTDPGPVDTSASKNKNFMKLFLKSPKRAAAQKAIAATTPAASNVAETRDEGEICNRQAVGSPGLADGTSDYQHLTSEHHSPVSSQNSLTFTRGNGKPMTPDERIKFEANLQGTDDEWISPSGRVRKHAKSTAADGTNSYQNQYMRQYSTDALELENSTIDDSFNGASRKRRMQIKTDLENLYGEKQNHAQSSTPKSQGTNYSSVSGLSGSSPVKSPESSTKQLINDLIWLEQKIAAPNATQRNSPTGEIEQNDSLSFVSGDEKISNAASSDLNDDAANLSAEQPEVIVCRDCMAPPGKLKIVIHSTKDGPAVHTVKKGSVLTGHLFAGDLIISVDNVDTRSYSAEQVMKLMTAKNKYERKITVLHIERGN